VLQLAAVTRPEPRQWAVAFRHWRRAGLEKKRSLAVVLGEPSMRSSFALSMRFCAKRKKYFPESEAPVISSQKQMDVQMNV
jgi:hypothetical protein